MKEEKLEIKCAYCNNMASTRLGVCMQKECLKKNHYRILYYEAVMWSSSVKPAGVEPPERFKKKAPWYKRWFKR